MWSVLATSVLMVLAAPTLIATLLMAALDRTINTSFFVAGGGGSSYLFENLFWFFGHPEVYILALPGVRHRARAAARLHPQAPVGLPPRGRRACSA